MPKRSGYLRRVQVAREQSNVETLRFTRQMMCDIALIVLHEEFGFGPERLRRFCEAIAEKYGDYADLWNGDTADVEYSRHVMDRALRQICGEYFIPWDERYADG